MHSKNVEITQLESIVDSISTENIDMKGRIASDQVCSLQTFYRETFRYNVLA